MFVLVHSPLVGPSTWAPVAAVLAARGERIAVPTLGVGRPPYWHAHVAAAAAVVAGVGEDLVLVAHSGAGPLLGLIADACAPWVARLVFVDAGLPAADESRLEAMRRTEPKQAAALAAHLQAGGRFPTWTDEDLAEEVPDDERRGALLAELQPRGLDFFTETIPAPDAPLPPARYVRFSAHYAGEANAARERGWPVTQLAGSHFLLLTAPDAVADALVAH